MTPRGLSNDWSPAEKGTLCVELVGASDLVAADDNGLSDPFAVFTLGFAEAKAYCRSLGKRLPSSVEWQYAGQGNLTDANGEALQYPWGQKDNATG